jgi:hypothetical protein
MQNLMQLNLTVNRWRHSAMNQGFRHRHLLASLGLLGLAAFFAFFSTFFLSFEP